MTEHADHDPPTNPPPAAPSGTPPQPPPYQGPPAPPYAPMPPPYGATQHGSTQHGSTQHGSTQPISPQPGYASYGSPAAYPPAPGYGVSTGYPVAPTYGGSVHPVPPQALASPGQRLVGALLTGLLIVVTLVIGYVVWAVIAWTNSTTPAKQVLGMKVVDARTGAAATFGQMVMRQLVWSTVLIFASSVTLGVVGIVDAFFVFGSTRQRLLDKMAGTLVVR